MAYKEKKDAIAYNNKYNKESYDRVNLTIPKGKKEEVQAEAQRRGESVNGFIWGLIQAQLDGASAVAGGYGFSGAAGGGYCVSCSISHAEAQKITALLHDGQTVGDFIKMAIAEKIAAEEKADNG